MKQARKPRSYFSSKLHTLTRVFLKNLCFTGIASLCCPVERVEGHCVKEGGCVEQQRPCLLQLLKKIGWTCQWLTLIWWPTSSWRLSTSETKTFLLTRFVITSDFWFSLFFQIFDSLYFFWHFSWCCSWHCQAQPLPDYGPDFPYGRKSTFLQNSCLAVLVSLPDFMLQTRGCLY